MLPETMKHYFAGVLLLFYLNLGFAQQDSILLFVSYEDTYYSEYVVMVEALVAAGYYVDVRSAGSGSATTYTIGGDLTVQANGLTGSNYAAFETQFLSMFGNSWNVALNPVPASVPVSGTIQNVTSIAPYKALIVVGGTGAVDYRIDGTYADQGALSAATVQAAAEKLNALAAEALLLGKPIMGQCTLFLESTQYCGKWF
jgi:putative intracellular protease/amidase